MKKTRSPITTHVLDISKGKAAANVGVELEQKVGSNWKNIAKGKTNQDGRIEELLSSGSKVQKGIYRIRFQIGKYFKKNCFYPFAEIVFEVKNTNEHHHVPLVVSPFGYSTYRGT